MALNNIRNEVQPYAKAGKIPLAMSLNTEEAVEELLLISLTDADPLVDHLDGDMLIPHDPVHRALLRIRCVLHRIGQKVLQHLGNAAFIRHHHGLILIVERDRMRRMHLGEFNDHRSYDIIQIFRSKGQFKITGPYPRMIEEIGYDAVKT